MPVYDQDNPASWERVEAMARRGFRVGVCCVLMMVFPAYMLAGESAAAMLYTNGSTWLNGSLVPKSAAPLKMRSRRTR
jgi:hypothetical protein